MTALLLCLLVAMAMGICLIVIESHYKKLQEQCERMRETCENLEQLNYELRAARHDYLNHLQVVYGLLELGEYDELMAYIKPVYKDMQKTGKAMKTSKPALNALLQAKMEEAAEKEIDIYVEVKSDLKFLEIEDWQLCKVLSNLIDNAITVLGDVEGEKRIEIDVNETREAYIFNVSNNGPKIPDDRKNMIFRRGFTTKKSEGHGMGLAIVSDILKENHGQIELQSTETETSFKIVFGKG